MNHIDNFRLILSESKIKKFKFKLFLQENLTTLITQKQRKIAAKR